jgi:hypothetical protein
LSTALIAEKNLVTEATELADSLSSQLGDVTKAANYNAYMALGWLAEDVALMQEAGLDPTTADALLAELGETETWIEWVNTDWHWTMTDAALIEIDDPVLTETFYRFVEAEIGSPEEQVALAEFQIRLAFLILEPIEGG